MVAKVRVRVLSVPVSGTRGTQRASFSSSEQCGELGKGQPHLEHEAGNASPLQGLCCGGRNASRGEVSLPSNSLVLWSSFIRSPPEVTSIFSALEFSVACGIMIKCSERGSAVVKFIFQGQCSFLKGETFIRYEFLEFFNVFHVICCCHC